MRGDGTCVTVWAAASIVGSLPCVASGFFLPCNLGCCLSYCSHAPMIDHPRRVFISYAQESEGHSAWVLEFAQRLRDDGVDALIDRYFPWVENCWRG